MHFIDELFKELRIRGHLEELKKIPTVKERWERLAEILPLINIFKERLSFLSSDEQLYLGYKIQEKGTNVGLCQHFYIFFSNRNKHFHYVCRAGPDKKRTYCSGSAEKCNKNYK